MSDLFRDYTTFNDDISQWDTSNVVTMRQMFYNASSFNQPIGDWDVSNVTDMYYMFCTISDQNPWILIRNSAKHIIHIGYV